MERWTVNPQVAGSSPAVGANSSPIARNEDLYSQHSFATPLSNENMSNKQTAERVIEAVNSSGNHYRNSLPMIASENILSPMVRKACDSDLHGRYAEGLPGKRYYQGCDDFDDIEQIGIDSAKRVFNCTFANIQSTSGTNSNMGALKALTKPGDKITAVSTADGGHISHARMGAVGVRGLDLFTYPWDEDRMEPDIDAAAELIRNESPSVALFGQSVFLFPTPLEDLSDAAHEVGARVMFDAAHVIGLIAGGQFQDPLREGADVMTGSSHKTFPGPQGGFVLSDSDDEKIHRRLNSGIFPGVCSSYHLHHVAGKAIALSEFEEFGQAYSTDIVANAKALGEALASEGFEVLAEDRGYTESHQVVTRHGEVDSGAGRDAAARLEESGIITNMNMLPGDTKALSPSGLRLGTPELTRVGMGVDEMQDVARFFSRALIKLEEPAQIKKDVKDFKSEFQNVQYCFEPGPAYP